MKKKILSLLLLPLLFISCDPGIPALIAGTYVVKSFDKNFENIDLRDLKLIVEDRSNEAVFLQTLTFSYLRKDIDAYRLEDLEEISNPEYGGYLVSYGYNKDETGDERKTNYIDYRFIGTQISLFPPIFGYGDIGCEYYEALPSYINKKKLKTGYQARTFFGLRKEDKDKKLNITFEIDLLNYNYDENNEYVDYTVTETSKIVFVQQ